MADGGRAAVLGSGIAGLLAAHVLVRRGWRVLVLERDGAPTGGPRKGVPQGNHVHVLLKAGERAMEELLPGFVAELEAAGSHPLDFSAHFRWFHHGAWRVRFNSGEITHFQSRPLLEALLRSRLLTAGRVEFRYDTVASGLEIDLAAQRIRGVKYRASAAVTGDGTERIEPVDLVVDASGRGSPLPRWLAANGYSTPPEERIALDLAYASRIVRARPECLDGRDALLVLPLAPGETRAGAIFPIEADSTGGRWLVTLAGYLGDHAPADPAGWLDFARGLPRPELFQAVREAEPLSEISTFRFPAARWLRYDRLRRLPRGLVALGDGVCSFDPLFGQGMSAAAMAVRAFDRHLEKDPTLERPRRLARLVGKVLAAPWLLASSEGLREPRIEGHRPFWLSGLQRYTHQVFLLTSTSPAVYRRILRVLNLLDAPPIFFHPAILARVVAEKLHLTRNRPVRDLA